MNGKPSGLVTYQISKEANVFLRPKEIVEIGGLILALTVAVGFSAGTVVVAVHFITKFW